MNGGMRAARDEQAVPQADGAGDAERGQAGDPRRLVVVDLQLGGDDAGERHAGADGEIDAADEDDERHADADDDDLGDLRREVREVAGGEERLARLGMEREAEPQRARSTPTMRRRAGAQDRATGCMRRAPGHRARESLGGARRVGDDVRLRDGAAASSSATTRPCAQDEDAIGEPQHLGQIGRGDEHGDAARA